jgi:hypothetical protein
LLLVNMPVASYFWIVCKPETIRDSLP